MNILYLIKQKPDETLEKMIEEHKKTDAVSIVKLTGNKNFCEIIDMIENSDRVISW